MPFSRAYSLLRAAGGNMNISPRVRRWRVILDKLEPPEPRPELPPLNPPGTPSMALAKKRGAAAVATSKLFANASRLGCLYPFDQASDLEPHGGFWCAPLLCNSKSVAGYPGGTCPVLFKERQSDALHKRDRSTCRHF